ncbi:hypothetical protein EVAR_101768_1 [Eumeta japonica]|uniref:Uncharacterized protein n=1 Tax=Eumeta variegata TaxID=151549 RepID=A0A4C1SN27_EUMVA|nr:hypothetical protein EVAR_101768_1 [Eumeta japonica]
MSSKVRLSGIGQVYAIVKSAPYVPLTACHGAVPATRRDCFPMRGSQLDGTFWRGDNAQIKSSRTSLTTGPVIVTDRYHTFIERQSPIGQHATLASAGVGIPLSLRPLMVNGPVRFPRLLASPPEGLVRIEDST